jgi:hypothetical protein
VVAQIILRTDVDLHVETATHRVEALMAMSPCDTTPRSSEAGSEARAGVARADSEDMVPAGQRGWLARRASARRWPISAKYASVKSSMEDGREENHRPRIFCN